MGLLVYGEAFISWSVFISSVIGILSLGFCKWVSCSSFPASYGVMLDILMKTKQWQDKICFDVPCKYCTYKLKTCKT